MEYRTIKRIQGRYSEYGPFAGLSNGEVNELFGSSYHSVNNGFPVAHIRDDLQFDDYDDNYRFGCFQACALFHWFGPFWKELEDMDYFEIAVFRVPLDSTFSTAKEETAFNYWPSKGSSPLVEQSVFDWRDAEEIQTIPISTRERI